MKNRKTISLSAVLYTMLKQWKIMLIVFVIIALAGSGYTLMKSRAHDSSKDVSDVIKRLDEKNKATIDGYSEYIEKSAFMNLDPMNLHVHDMYYYIDWKEQGLDTAALESKYETLHQYMALYYPSDEFAGEIIAANNDYKDKALYELVGVYRSGNQIRFSFVFSDDYYVKDLSNVIDSTLKKKSSEWMSSVGAFEIIPGPSSDKPIDGILSGHKEAQDNKRNILANIQSTNKTTEAMQKTTKESPLFRQLVVVFIIALLAGVVVGGIAAIYRRRLDTSADVYDIVGEDVLCVIGSEPEKGLDRWFYRKNDKYRDPELYLSIVNRKMADAGTKRAYLYNCSEEDVSFATGRIVEQLKSVDVVNIDKKSNRDFFLKMTEEDDVILLIKSGATDKRDFLRIREHLEAIGVKTAGVVFLV